jgi:hypothetical protein
MLRKVLAVIVGYLLMAIAITVGMMAVMFARGPEAAFDPGTWDPSTPWIASSLVIGLIGAALGGFICAVIARAFRPVLALVIVVVGIGLAMVAYQVAAPTPNPGPRTITLSLTDPDAMKAMRENTRTPLWVQVANMEVGAAGVFAGGRLKKSPA